MQKMPETQVNLQETNTIILKVTKKSKAIPTTGRGGL
jgi:hypothetical protein